MRFLLLLALFCVSAKPPQDRRPSPPFITGDGFRAHAQFVIDKPSRRIDAAGVKSGDLIFVQSDTLPHFFQKVHPKISQPYILITHNSDLSIPGDFAYMLSDPKIVAWFGQNVDGYTHPKLHPIPLGLENRIWPRGDLTVIARFQEEYRHLPKTMLLYNNFSVGTCVTERGRVFELFKDKPFCTTASGRTYPEYLKDLAQTLFVLSPRGNGLDCHRTWEALYMGAIPIVKHSASDSIYEGLPVVLVDDWTQVTEEFLQQTYQEILAQEHHLDRLFLAYWLEKIDAVKFLRNLCQ